MTPTLWGRWQTRILLYIFIGLPMTLLYALILNFRFDAPISDLFVVLTAIFIVGFVADIAYIQIQRFRWDGDWPFAFQFFFSILEFLIVYGLAELGAFQGLLQFDYPFSFLLTHFLLVFIPSFLALLGGVQLFLIRWRFKGGEWGRHEVQ